jgi:Tfp pilus assembly protein FimT
MLNRGQSGYSVTELAIVCMVAVILASAAIPLFNNATSQTNADAAAQLIAQELTYARASAVGSHAPVAVQFDSTANTIVVGPGTPSPRGPFPIGSKIRLQSAAISPDTPDGLNSTVLGTGSHSQITFLDNGSAVDDPVNNNIASGTIFLQHSNGDPSTRRAVTLMGGTGRVHKWRYDTGSSSWK